MPDVASGAHGAPEEATDFSAHQQYDPPSVTYLGTLHELTLGGSTGPDDGVGGAGGAGSI
jgi:hypothetical protein